MACLTLPFGMEDSDLDITYRLDVEKNLNSYNENDSLVPGGVGPVAKNHRALPCVAL